ncbi:MAG: hypothetical protein A3A10_03135 [Candidatus Tagabacteria bacterium RIFCSPLOWO2_01_FULL_42_9]|uniref:Uncharacterized protein n=1 Tax=Candidatus Tagabacteria bacterium RIFCSPLOWO2_01_FULL_42_9 TaxID=1802296 RepID=A0A1G2LW75_9BACT|nr:MAG: hypothetical protein A3A10_03135 [Candidatus Tagabacteria bacterium RIFCSPLOWO2_01_FULL_42_9]
MVQNLITARFDFLSDLRASQRPLGNEVLYALSEFSSEDVLVPALLARNEIIFITKRAGLRKLSSRKF